MVKHIVVGGGLTGIVLAWKLAKQNHETVLVESGDELGTGEVIRKNGAPVVTGPKIYSTSFRQFEAVLNEMEIPFHNVFRSTDDNFKFSFSSISHIDKIKLARVYFAYSVGIDYSQVDILTYMSENNFSGQSIDYISRFCPAIDGASADKFSVQALMNFINYESLNSHYQPLLANDKRLFPLMERALAKAGVIIAKSQKCQHVLSRNGTAYGINTIGMKNGKMNNGGQKILGDKIIFTMEPAIVSAIPVVNVGDKERAAQGISSGYASKSTAESLEDKLAYTGTYKNPFQIKNISQYNDLYGVCFSWKLNSYKFKNGITNSTHGLVIADLKLARGTEDYEQTIACNLTLDVKYNGKKLYELEPFELIDCVWANLLEVYPDLPRYSVANVVPAQSTISRSNVNFKPLPTTCAVSNLYMVGSHTAEGNYGFTSDEAAVGSVNEVVDPSWTIQYSVNWLILFILIVILAIVIGYKVMKSAVVKY